MQIGGRRWSAGVKRAFDYALWIDGTLVSAVSASDDDPLTQEELLVARHDSREPVTFDADEPGDVL